MRAARPVPLALAAALLVATGCGSGDPGTSTGEQACAAPATVVAAETVTPGQTVLVTGLGLWTGCVDSGAAAEDGPVVYDGSDVDPELLTGQAVTWRQGDDVVELAVVDAGVDGSAAAVVTIPAGARDGTGELAVGIATPVVVSVVGP
ncbi:hypothetical protein [Jiangella sp. DSM 45060]|uniref:hypothetical protein n=1 Tax=Jiangella sp. DSM 45060 TaxID=1798224 RepID=UPI00087B34B8|nr:hypothetical protein [Jiangella sp. DSM 45060]SDT39180.1 hypothetical protein SAMN04515669_3848 [Jiangella sp. DSM 45060]